MKLIFTTSWNYQIEILPRLTVIYGKGIGDCETTIVSNGIALEWLWFSLFLQTSTIEE